MISMRIMNASIQQTDLDDQYENNECQYADQAAEPEYHDKTSVAGKLFYISFLESEHSNTSGDDNDTCRVSGEQSGGL